MQCNHCFLSVDVFGYGCFILYRKRLKIMSIFTYLRKKYNYLVLKKASPKKRAILMRTKFYHVGENVELYTLDFGTEPYLIRIDDNVVVAAGVRFITHDVSCFRVAKYLNIPFNKVDKVGSISLGENCFIGAFTTLLPNTSVGKNSFVAACSVVTKDIPEGEVWGGIPAHFIMTTDEYSKHVITNCANYPWLKEIESLSEEELIKMRQEYFFGRIKK